MDRILVGIATFVTQTSAPTSDENNTLEKSITSTKFKNVHNVHQGFSSYIQVNTKNQLEHQNSNNSSQIICLIE